MKIPFFTKHYSGSYIGGILETYQRAGIFISALQFLAVVVIFYTTSAQPAIELYTPWLSFTLYMGIVIVGILLLMVAVKLLVIPSSYTFLNKQMWTNNNPMRAKLEEIEARQKMIMEKLGLVDESDKVAENEEEKWE